MEDVSRSPVKKRQVSVLCKKENRLAKIRIARQAWFSGSQLAFGGALSRHS